MTKDDYLQSLEDVRVEAHEEFRDHPDRLAQLDSALATAAMVVEHLFDEEVRHKHDPLAHAKAIGQHVRAVD